MKDILFFGGNMKDKIDKYLGERVQLVFSGYHLKDNILDDITVEELQDMLVSNIPVEKLDERTAMKEFETLLKMKVRDARFVAKKVIPEIVSEIRRIQQ